MPFKDKEAKREATRKAMERKRQGITKEARGITKTPENVIPNVIPPTMADVDANRAWVVLKGPRKGEIVWHSQMAQSWQNVPCEIVDGVCVADHGPNYHGHPVAPILDVQPLTAWLREPNTPGMPRLERLQRIAGSLGKFAHEVRFGLDGPTFEEIGETIGIKPPVYPKG